MTKCKWFKFIRKLFENFTISIHFIHLFHRVLIYSCYQIWMAYKYQKSIPKFLEFIIKKKFFWTLHIFVKIQLILILKHFCMQLIHIFWKTIFYQIFFKLFCEIIQFFERLKVSTFFIFLHSTHHSRHGHETQTKTLQKKNVNRWCHFVNFF